MTGTAKIYGHKSPTPVGPPPHLQWQNHFYTPVSPKPLFRLAHGSLIETPPNTRLRVVSDYGSCLQVSENSFLEFLKKTDEETLTPGLIFHKGLIRLSVPDLKTPGAKEFSVTTEAATIHLLDAEIFLKRIDQGPIVIYTLRGEANIYQGKLKVSLKAPYKMHLTSKKKLGDPYLINRQDVLYLQAQTDIPIKALQVPSVGEQIKLSELEGEAFDGMKRSMQKLEPLLYQEFFAKSSKRLQNLDSLQAYMIEKLVFLLPLNQASGNGPPKPPL